MACVTHTVSRKFAEDVVNSMSEEQQHDLGIDKEHINGALDAIQRMAEEVINSTPVEDRDAVIDNPKDFITRLEDSWGTIKASGKDLENLNNTYTEVNKIFTQVAENAKQLIPDISISDLDNHRIGSTSNPILIAALRARFGNKLNSATKLITLRARQNSDGSETLTWIVKKPVNAEDLRTPQQKTIDRILDIHEEVSKNLSKPHGVEIINIETQETKKVLYTDLPGYWKTTEKLRELLKKSNKFKDLEVEKWELTGRKFRLYKGKEVAVMPITTLVHGVTDDKFPILAGPLGTAFDTVARAFFARKKKDEANILYDADGKLKEEQLQTIINASLGGVFSVKGLTKLLKELEVLEKIIYKKWPDCQIISDEISLLGKVSNGNGYNLGIPDLIVVDKEGIGHVMDFKTRILNLEDYTSPFPESTAEGYAQQIMNYIKLLESWGIRMGQEGFLIAADTWYIGSDLQTEMDPVSKIEVGSEDIYTVEHTPWGEVDNLSINENDKTGLTEEMTLGEYSESEDNPTRAQVYTPDSKVLYVEPHLHLKDYSTEEEDPTEENLDALMGDELLHISDEEGLSRTNRPEISYERQWESLTDEEKAALEELGGAPVKMQRSKEITTYSTKDIEGNPKLISSSEIQMVAEQVMLRVHRAITLLQKGKERNTYRSRRKLGKRQHRGMSRYAIIKDIGLYNIIYKELQFLKDKADLYKNMPTLEEFKEGKYDTKTFTFEDEADYLAKRKQNEKADWLWEHRNQLLLAGTAKLVALEDVVCFKDPNEDKKSKDIAEEETPDPATEILGVDLKEDTGDNESNENFTDMYQEGLSDIEAWMMGIRNYSPKASLSRELKMFFENILLRDAEGNTIKDPYGWAFELSVDPTYATQTILDAVKNCSTIEQMLDKLKELALTEKWVEDVINKIEADKTFKTKFYRNFRKDALNYSICTVKLDTKTGNRVVLTQIINQRSAFQTMMDSLTASFYRHSVGSFTYNGIKMSLIDEEMGFNRLVKIGDKMSKTTVGDIIIKSITEIEENLSQLTTDAQLASDAKDKEERRQQRREYIAANIGKKKFGDKTITAKVAEILQGIGVQVSEAVIVNICKKNIDKENNAKKTVGKICKLVTLVLQDMANVQESKRSIELSGKGSPFKHYKPLLTLLADSVQETVEASVYQDGKTYYSYTNPSRLGAIVRQCKDAMEDPASFEEYIENNYGRYKGWFTDQKGNWLNDWLKKFTDEKKGEDYRDAFNHKVEVSYIGNQYKNLGSLGFQLSILHNYYGTSQDRVENPNLRWFALPTMSNKPTNEFLSMIKYKDPEEIIKRVLLPTFQQECNRIADVLQHFASGKQAVDNMDITEDALKDVGYTAGSIEQLKDRINNRNITEDDLISLSKVISGAKFHFLWYLNSTIAEKKDLEESLSTPKEKRIFEESTTLGKEVANKINLLMTPDSNEKNTTLDLSRINNLNKVMSQVLQTAMDRIVESELEEMRKIGLFAKENKKVNGQTVKVLKYQEEFNGELGHIDLSSIKNEQDANEAYRKALAEMENALRDFIWQDIAANINIIQLTGIDLAYYDNSINYQKRIAQVHSPGLNLLVDDEVCDGYLRNIHISDDKAASEVVLNAEAALEEYRDANVDPDSKNNYNAIIAWIKSEFKKINGTDGQGFSCPTSYRKKLKMQGEWDDEKENAYNEIVNKGNFSINNLNILLQPSKPFETAVIPKLSGSNTIDIRPVPIQNKNSEYLILLAEALSRGAKKQSKMSAIFDFMEATAKTTDIKGKTGRIGIDTVNFDSVGKVGLSGVIDLKAFDATYDQRYARAVNDRAHEVIRNGKEIPKEEAYSALLTKFLLDIVSRDSADPEIVADEDELIGEGTLAKEEAGYYNNRFVDTVPVENYIIQQEVPAHFLEHEQLYGSQSRILGISDITPGTTFSVWNSQTGKMEENVEANDLIDEFKNLHAENITEAYEDLREELGLTDLQKEIDKLNEGRSANRGEDLYNSVADLPVGSAVRDAVFKKLSFLLQQELCKDAKYGLDTRRACCLEYDSNGHVVDFIVPLMDPTQSNRIQMLLNSIIKKRINKQRINGGSLVQVTAYDNDLHIKFKGADGQPLKTFQEYGKSEAEYKQYLKNNKASIEHFECYAPIPNAVFQRLITKEDGSLMSVEEVKKNFPNLWESLSKMIGYRIPTEDKYSMIPLKIKGFLPLAAGQAIMMPREITLLTGSDFDIDKLYIMLKDLDIKLPDPKNEEEVTEFLKKNDLKAVIQKVMSNARRIVLEGEAIAWNDGLEEFKTDFVTTEVLNDICDKCRAAIMLYVEKNSKEYTDTKAEHRGERRKARNNRLLDLQWAVLTNADTMPKMLNPGNFEPQKKMGRVIRAAKTKGIKEYYTRAQLERMSVIELDALLAKYADQHNTTLPSTKIYYQRQNMQGSQMVGIMANNNVSHAFMSFQNVRFDLNKLGDNTFAFAGRMVGDRTKLDPQKDFTGQLISKTIASYLAASVDTAKDPVLADLNINTFTGSVAMLLTRIGFSVEEVGLFLSQPIIMQLSDLFFQNKAQGYYDGNTAIKELAATLGIKKDDYTSPVQDTSILTVENLYDHLNDENYAEDGDEKNYQTAVLSAFYRMFLMAGDLQKLTYCTKFNSVSNAAGPTIADTVYKESRVQDFFAECETNSFYVPEDGETDNEGNEYTDPTKIIENDPILNAFYESTLGKNGASNVIFRNFFPHYWKGFQNVLDHFRENYLGGKKVDTKLYNQFLNDYLYFLLTYENKEQGINPTLPYSDKDKGRLVVNLIEDFKRVSAIKGRTAPNAILDSKLGGTYLRVREADQFLNVDILVFNSGQLNAEQQQTVKNAWSDMITMNDPALSEEENQQIRDFGVDLFFYTLMRNGFGFNARTLMHLASTVVKANATYSNKHNNYIKGLRNLRNIDALLMGEKLGSIAEFEQFCSQFARNHSNNRKVVPNISMESDIVKGETTTGIALEVGSNEEYKLDRLKGGGNTLRRLITVTRKENGKLYQELYELEMDDNTGEPLITNDGNTITASYKKSSKLGLVNNFIEYDANSNIEVSFFEDIRGASADALDDEQEVVNSNTEERAESSGEFEGTEVVNDRESMWNSIAKHLNKVKGWVNSPKDPNRKEHKAVRLGLKNMFKAASEDSDIYQTFMVIRDAKLAEKHPEAVEAVLEEYRKKTEAEATKVKKDNNMCNQK